MDKKTKTIIISGAVLLMVLIAVFAVFHDTLMPKGDKGEKTISVTITADGVSKEHKINTDEAYLRKALEEKNLIFGEESQFGLYIKKVGDRTADEGKQEWWCFMKDGEMLMTGVDTAPISDGDSFEIVLKSGYDE